MTCQRIRENLMDSLAAGESALSGEIALHVRSCDGCSSFYENQTNLLRSIDAGVRTMVNQEVPPSLLSDLRARLSEPASRRAWISAWNLAAAMAAAAVLTLSVGYLRRRPEVQPNLSANSAVVRAHLNNPTSPEQPAPEWKVTQLPVARKQANRKMPVLVTVQPPAEVIVLAEEREAFARFAAVIPQNREVAVALTKPAPFQPDVLVEIALLRIDEMDLKPLNPAVEPGN